MDRYAELSQKIVAYIVKHNRCPNYSSVGTNYDEGQPIFKRMFNEGLIESVTQISPKGRKMRVIRVVQK